LAAARRANATKRSASCRTKDLRSPSPDSTAKKDEDEVIEPRTFTIDEARALVQSGEIVDLKTVAGLTLV
jgi:hypothetical protein